MIEEQHQAPSQPAPDVVNQTRVGYLNGIASVRIPGGTRRRESGHRQRVALLDDSPLRRISTLTLLRAHLREGARGFGGAQELLTQLQGGLPSSVIVSAGSRSLAESPLREDVQALRRGLPSTPLIVLSDLTDSDEVLTAFRQGARGYIPTSLDPRVVIEAIRMILAGCAFVPVELMIRFRQRGALGRSPVICPPELPAASGRRDEWPPRQLAVLRLLVQGRANKEIARALTMEESTVKVHVRHIMRKLGAANRTQAALCAARLGFTATPQIADVGGACLEPVAAAPGRL